MKQEAQICLQCVGDEELRNLLSESATCMECSFCEEHRLAVPLKTLADHIDEVYREHFKPGNWSYLGQEGSPPQDIIEGIALLEPEVAAAVIEILAAQEARDVRDGADPYYEHGFNYVQNDYAPYELEWSWNEFYHRIKHRRRYFDDEARSHLHGLLGNLEELEPAPVLTLHPDDPCSTFFRARRAAGLQQAEKFIENARREFGPPPPEVATAGRMNAHGIPVFYGTFSEEVAVAEVRPYVGGIIVVGQFRVIRPLKLLDLSRYLRHATPGSVFASDYYSRVTQFKFLQQFASIISRPIQPSDEALEYVATQAIAEYLANELGFDGIVYPSAQVGSTDFDDDDDENDEALLSSSNVALFEVIGLIEGQDQGCDASIGGSQMSSAEIEAPSIEDFFPSLSPAVRNLLPDLPPASDNELHFSAPAEKGPALRYVENSAKAVRVTSIKVDYEPA